MNVVVTVAGAALIAAALRDIFHTVFHPRGRGGLSVAVQRAVWRLFRGAGRRRPELLSLAGPNAMIASVLLWTTLLALGWALVRWPWLPGGFLLATGLDPADQNGFLDALYLSLVTLATLGYGDIAPRAGWLRIAAPLEAFVGFALMTAAISWVLSVYPVLGRRRSLAEEVALLQATEAAMGVSPLALEPEPTEALLADLTTRLVTVRVDLVQFPVTYYFPAGDARSSVAAALPALVRLADAATAPARPLAVRFRATMLRRAVEAVAGELGGTFLDRPRAPLDELLRAYAVDHHRSPMDGGPP